MIKSHKKDKTMMSKMSDVNVSIREYLDATRHALPPQFQRSTVPSSAQNLTLQLNYKIFNYVQFLFNYTNHLLLPALGGVTLKQ